jgi:hypothetical protein
MIQALHRQEDRLAITHVSDVRARPCGQGNPLEVAMLEEWLSSRVALAYPMVRP